MLSPMSLSGIKRTT